MREIVVDTETTGLDPTAGDRVVEIGCVELINHIPSGRKFHRYVNPQRSMSMDAAKVHGLDEAFLRDKPAFAAVAAELTEFLADAVLVAHNAEFDLAFLNSEFGRAGHSQISGDRVVDTLMLARRKFPLGPNSLDALMSRYSIDASRRVVHGALLDAELLSEVYIELLGGRQASLLLGEDESVPTFALPRERAPVAMRTMPRLFQLSEEERAAHQAAIERLGEKAIWRKYMVAAPVAPPAAAAAAAG